MASSFQLVFSDTPEAEGETIGMHKRCLVLGSDPACDVVKPSLPLQALAVAHHRSGCVHLYAFDADCVVAGDAWRERQFYPLTLPCDVSHGQVSFTIEGHSEALRDTMKKVESDEDEELRQNTNTNRQVKRPRDESAEEDPSCTSKKPRREMRRVSFSPFEEVEPED